jgi:hypothetical protein
MSSLDRAIAALDVLGSVVQAVPVVGENLKSAFEVTKKTCELAKVRMRSWHGTRARRSMQKMKENREEYEQLADRAAKLLTAVANTIMKATPEKLKGMEGNVGRLLMYVVEPITFTRCADPIDQHAEGDQVDHRCTSRRSDPDKQARLCEEVHSHQGQSRCANLCRPGRNQETQRAARPGDRRIRRAFPNDLDPSNRAHCVDQVTSSIRVELVAEDVRALSMRLSKRTEEMNHEMATRLEKIQDEVSRSAMNGV